MPPVTLAAGFVLLLAAVQDDPADIQRLCVERRVTLACAAPAVKVELDERTFDMSEGSTHSEMQQLTVDLHGRAYAEGTSRLRCTLHTTRRRSEAGEGLRDDVEFEGRFGGLAVECLATPRGLETVSREDRPAAVELLELREMLCEALGSARAHAADGALEDLDTALLLRLVAPPLPHDPGAAHLDWSLQGLPITLVSPNAWPELEVDGLMTATVEESPGQERKVRLQGRLSLRVKRVEAPAEIWPIQGSRSGERRTRWSGILEFDGYLSWRGHDTRWSSSADARFDLHVDESAQLAHDQSWKRRNRSPWTGTVESCISSD